MQIAQIATAAFADVTRAPARRGVRLLWPGALALLLLASACVVYLLDRTPGAAALMPAAWQRAWQGAVGPADAGGWFGAVGLWWPSLVHAFAFSVLTAMLLPRTRTHAAAACAFWALIDTVAECGQHAALAGPLAAAVEDLFGRGPWATPAARYFTHGAFDGADVAAGLAGCVLAYLALCATRTHNTSDSGSRL